MSMAYDELLDATIRHLEGLKSRGVRHLGVTPEVLRALSQPPPKMLRPVASAPVFPARPASIPASAPTEPEPTPTDSRPITIMPPKKVAVPAKTETPASAAPVRVARSKAEKPAAFAELRERALVCQKCAHLHASRKNVVFGVGNIDAQLMFVGEAPGADEDEQGEPFIGRAGQLLTKIIEATGLQRGDVYIANILKCRPDTPGQSAGNRKPTPDEMATCIPYLHEQIDIIQPKVLIALGATAVEGLLGKTLGITKLRGNWQTYRGTPLMPTYHPAYLLRNQAMSEKRKVWEDFLQVMEKLEMPISAKQRNFFLKAG
jgi:DNA polymerase